MESNKNRGFTMLEMITALGLFLLLSMLAMNLLLLTSNVSGRLMVKQELLENARIAMDFMTANIAMAEEITLLRRSDGTMNRLSLKETDSSGTMHDYVYQYDSTLPKEHVKYHRLEMGGNELASYIAEICVDIDSEREVISVYIRTDDRLEEDSGKVTEPVVLTGKVKIKYKKISI